MTLDLNEAAIGISLRAVYDGAYPASATHV
jgi:hypothetical protein